MFGMGGSLNKFSRNGAGGMGSSIPGLSGILNSNGAGSPVANATGTTSVGPGGGMNVMGTLQNQSDFATQFQGNPGSGPAAGGFGRGFGIGMGGF